MSILYIAALLSFLPYSFAAEQPALIDHTSSVDNNPTHTWDQLQRTSLHKLTEALSEKNQNDELTAWMQLAIITKENSSDTFKLVNALLDWRKNNPRHAANALFPEDPVLEKILNNPQKKHLALLLPLSGPFATQGKLVRNGILAGYYKHYSATQDEQVLSIYDTNLFPNMLEVYQKAIQEGADFVIGPLTKNEVNELAKQKSFPVPTLALNYTDQTITTPYFYEFGLSTKDEAEQAALKAFAKGHTEALIITANDHKNIAHSFVSKWKSLGGHIVDSFYYNQKTDFAVGIANLLKINDHDDRENMKLNNDKTILAEQRRHDFDVIFLSATPKEARIIVPLLKYYYADDIPIYSLSTILSNTPDLQKNMDLNGVYIPYIPFNSDKNNQTKRLFAVGYDAYLLSRDLARLEQLPNFPIYAETGALTINSGQIYRRLPWMQIHDSNAKS